MELIMLFGDEMIDKIKVNARKAKTPDYLLDLKEALIARNEENLNCCSDEPRFAFARLYPKTAVPNNRRYV